MFRCINADDLGISTRQSELIELALTYGFRGLYVDISEVMKRAKTRGKEHACRFLLSADIRVALFTLPVDLQADDETFNRQLAEVEESLALFQELGCSRCETLIAPASSSLPYHENFERHRQRIGVVAETLSKGEMHLGLGLQAAASHREGAEFQFIHKADDLLTLINTTRAENVGLALDTWNWLVGGGSVEQLRGLKGDQIVSVKLSDVPADADLATISEDQRLLPGSGGLVDCALILHVLAENGFKGPIGLAADPSHLTGQTREAIVQNARNVLDQQWSAAGLDSAGRLAPASVEG